VDINATASGLLRDMASVQPSRQQQYGYNRAATTILRLPTALTELIGPDGRLPKIPLVGPSSTRILMEVLATGASAIVEAAVLASGRGAEIERRRALRAGFLSRAAVLAVLAAPAPGAIGREDYRGDLQMHSRWSDGVHSVAQLAEAAVVRGYDYIGITDHSKGLPVARGMTPDTVRAQQRDISDVNRAANGRLRVIKGLEANILVDGELDVGPEDLAGVELVLAAPHSQLRSTDDQTGRLVRAIERPEVHVLAHPRGRMSDSRAGLRVRWDRVFRAAVKHQVAIELDGDPHRQDLDHALAREALDAGCQFALDSDAHSTEELIYAEIAIAHARLAGIPANRVINCWPLSRLLAWLKR
jgi:histidinol phosphatase-like PHP family hydrolase